MVIDIPVEGDNQCGGDHRLEGPSSFHLGAAEAEPITISVTDEMQPQRDHCQVRKAYETEGKEGDYQPVPV